MPSLDRDGVSLHYEVHGAGPPILLTHGFAASSRMWRGQVDALANEHQLILWDMRGHGLSDYPTDPKAYSEKATVADMAAILDAVGAERAIIGGMSLGGYMSHAFHALFPERTRALLIVDTGPGYRSEAAREAWNETARERGDRLDAEGLAALETAGIEARTAGHSSAAGLAHAARGMLTQRTATVIDSLPRIRVPSIVVVGADDAPYLAASSYMASKIPGARHVVVPGAGHAANIDQPELFNRALLDFLGEAGL